MKLTVVIATVLPFVAVTVASSIGTGAGPSYSGYSQQAFVSGNRSPNATGSSLIRGIDTSRDSSTAAPINYNITINVTDISNGYTANSSLAVTNSVFSLSYPAGKGLDVADSDFGSCLIFFLDLPLNVTAQGQSDEGTGCDATLGQSCSKALQRAFLNAKGSVPASRRNGTCGGLGLVSQVPIECSGMMKSTSNVAFEATANSTRDGFFFQASDPHVKSNFTEYNSATTRIWPIMLMQYPSNATGSGILNAGLTCLRAKNATAGSQAVPSTVPGAGNTVKVSTAGMVLVGVIMMTLL